MVPVKPYPIWPWICTTLAFGALAFSYSEKRAVESSYAVFTRVAETGLTTWGQDNGVNTEEQMIRLEVSYDAIQNEITIFGILTLAAAVVAVVLHFLHNRALRKRGII